MIIQTSPFAGYDIQESRQSDEDPPLLEELGINPEQIKKKSISVITFRHVEGKFLEDPDMAGPLLFVIVFGSLLLLTGKAHFGSIYGFGTLGSLGIYLVINFMSQNRDLDLYRTISILGYAFLPIVLLSAIGVFVPLTGTFGAFCALGAIMWSTYTASVFFETILEMKDQRWLVAYPIGLLYSCFTLLTVFQVV